MDQELDLRPLVLALLRNWSIVIVGVLLVLIGGVTWYVLTPPTYRGEARILVVRERMTADFNSGIRRDQTPVEPASLDTTLVKLATSDAVAQEVVERLGQDAGANVPTIEDLSSRMTANIDPNSDLLTLQVSHPDREWAIKIANNWAAAVVAHVNTIYGGDRNAAVLGAVEEQYKNAQQAYEQSEQELANFLRQDEGPILEQRIAEQQAIVDNMRLARTQIISQTAMVDIVQATNMISAYASLRWAGETTLIAEQTQQQVQKLRGSYGTLRRLQLARQEAAALRDHLSQGGDGTSAQLALQLLKAHVFAANENSPADLQIQVDLAGSASAGDVESLLNTIDARITALQADIAGQLNALRDGSAYRVPDGQPANPNDLYPDLQQQFLNLMTNNLLVQLFNSRVVTGTGSLASDDAIVAIQQEVQQLQSQLQILEARKFELEQQRDLAQTTYVALGRRISEFTSASVTDGQVLRVANQVIAASRASKGQLLIRIIIVMMAALLLLTGLILLREIGPSWLGQVQQKQPVVTEAPHAETSG